MKIENLREITDKASEAANKENLEHGDGTGVMVIRQSEYKYWEKDRTAREAMIRSGIEQWEAEIEKIRRTNVNFTTAIESLRKELDFMATSRNKYRLDAEELQTKLTAAEKRVAELEWRPVSVKPTREDADASGYVVAIIEGHYSMEQWDDVGRPFNYWRPAALPKQTTPEEKSRAEFEVIAMSGESERFGYEFELDGDNYADQETREAYRIFKAARKEMA